MRRALAILAAALSLSACMPTSSPAGGLNALLATPAPATRADGSPIYRYRWVMAHDWQKWGVQVGPKLDADGIHVAVYAWRDCSASRCAWEVFREYQALEPGSVHSYTVEPTPNGWSLRADGRELAVLAPGYAGAILTTGDEETSA